MARNRWVRVRSGLRAVGRDPGPSWRDRLTHHGFRALLVLLVAAPVPWMFPHEALPEFAGLEAGAVADREVIARVGFNVPKEPEQLNAEVAEAVAGVAPIFRLEASIADSSIARAREFFFALDSVIARIRADPPEADSPDEAAVALSRALEAVVTAELSRYGINFPIRNELSLLASDVSRQRIENALMAALDGPLRAGVAQSRELQAAGAPSIRIRRGSRDRLVPRDSVTTAENFFQSENQAAVDQLPSAATDLLYSLLVLFFEPTLRLDRDATRQARDMARQAVLPNELAVVPGERIVTEHERLGEMEVRKLRAYEAELARQGLAGSGLGAIRGLGLVLYVILLVGALMWAIFQYRPAIYRASRDVSVVFVLLLFTLATAGIVVVTGAPQALIPVALTALLLGALYDGVLALLVVATIAAVLMGQEAIQTPTIPLLTAAGGSAAALTVGELRRRSQSWILIAVITAAYLVFAFAFLMVGWIGWRELGGIAGVGFVVALTSTALAMGAAVPLLELFTGRATEQTLLELSDMNRPLLRRLAREAPGTYAHSINVANLAEAACGAIGADSTLTRVGVYYHDIGKLERPQYFIENQPKGLNPHDRLAPRQSAEVLRDHVRDGLALAEEARLPPSVKDFIREHHGTQLIQFFYQKAIEETPDLSLDPGDFCYPGPKPQSRETAIAMLADATESASRTLADPSPESIRGLIDRIVSGRMEEGQLDECGLTFRDLNRVKSEFARVLTGLYHHRIDYPAASATVAEGDTITQLQPVAELALAADDPVADNDRDASAEPPGEGVEPESTTVERYTAG